MDEIALDRRIYDQRQLLSSAAVLLYKAAQSDLNAELNDGAMILLQISSALVAVANAQKLLEAA